MPIQTDNNDPEQQALSHQKYRLRPGGEHIFFQVGNYTQWIKGNPFDPEAEPDCDVTQYFQGKLKVFHLGTGVKRQFSGAPLPAKPAGISMQYEPEKNLNWVQSDIVTLKMAQLEKRQAEKSIMGETANDAIARGGVAQQPFSPWAHTKPDHLNFLGRTEKKLRVPGYVGANQVHTAFESAAKLLAKKYNEIEVTRALGEPIAGESGLISELKLGFILRDNQNKPYHFSHNQPYFTSRGARNGDEVAIFRYMEIQKALLDAGRPTMADNVESADRKRRRSDPDLSNTSFVSVAGDYLRYLDEIDQAHVDDRAKASKRTPDTAVPIMSQSDSFTSSLDERPRSRDRRDRDI